jgi:hypothetical protein
VVNADIVPPKGYIANSSVQQRSPITYVNVDLSDMGQVMEVLSGSDWKYTHVDAVVHVRLTYKR